MKKLFSLIVVLAVVSSCTTDVRFNNPGFQAYRDNTLFRAVSVTATKSISTGVVTIQALAENETLTLTTTGTAVGTYNLGTLVTNNKATYNSTFDGSNFNYATNAVHGPVSTITSLSSTGTGYTANISAATTSTGIGTGLTVKTTVNTSGQVTSAKVASPGNNYYPGDMIRITGGGNNAIFYVVNVAGSNGVIDITNNADGTISGDFNFNAVNADGNPNAEAMVNFQNGSFYKIPVTSAP